MPGHNINFLLIEADPSSRQEMTAQLKQLDYGRVACVAEVREALIVLATGGVDFVICDWSDSNGPELGLLKLLKAQEVYKYIPFLMMAVPMPSAAQEGERQRRVAAARGDGYLTKPCSSAEFRKSIDEILSRFPSL